MPCGGWLGRCRAGGVGAGGMIARGCGCRSSAPLPAGGTCLPEPWFRSGGGFSVPACMLAPWQSCHGGGLALAARRLSCARHPPRPPTAAPVGALAEVHYLQRGFVLVLQPVSSACAWEPAAAAWEGACRHGVVFSSFHAGARSLRLPRRVLLCCFALCTDVDVLLLGVSAQRSMVQEQGATVRSREQLPPEQTSPSPASPVSVPASPSGSISLPSPGEGQVFPLSPCPCFGRCPLDFGCRTSLCSLTKPLLLGTERGWGGPGWDVSPRIPIRRGRVFTLLARGWLRGLHAARPPHQPGGRGGGREASLQPPGTKSQCGS